MILTCLNVPFLYFGRNTHTKPIKISVISYWRTSSRRIVEKNEYHEICRDRGQINHNLWKKSENKLVFNCGWSIPHIVICTIYQWKCKPQWLIDIIYECYDALRLLAFMLLLLLLLLRLLLFCLPSKRYNALALALTLVRHIRLQFPEWLKLDLMEKTLRLKLSMDFYFYSAPTHKYSMVCALFFPSGYCCCWCYYARLCV